MSPAESNDQTAAADASGVEVPNITDNARSGLDHEPLTPRRSTLVGSGRQNADDADTDDAEGGVDGGTVDGSSGDLGPGMDSSDSDAGGDTSESDDTTDDDADDEDD